MRSTEPSENVPIREEASSSSSALLEGEFRVPPSMPAPFFPITKIDGVSLTPSFSIYQISGGKLHSINLIPVFGLKEYEGKGKQTEFSRNFPTPSL